MLKLADCLLAGRAVVGCSVIKSNKASVHSKSAFKMAVPATHVLVADTNAYLHQVLWLICYGKVPFTRTRRDNAIGQCD